MIKAVVLDFDGVILETAVVKTRAFDALFADSGRGQEIRAYHIAHSGISRHVKIREIRERLLGLPRDAAEEAALAGRFAALIEQSVADAPFVPGVREFLLNPGSRLLFVASGTPDPELRRIARARGIERHFAGIFGSPALKPAIIGRILRSHALDPPEVVFVGDGLSDQQAARETGVHFVARLHDENDLEPAAWELADLRQLPATLEAIDAAAEARPRA